MKTDYVNTKDTDELISFVRTMVNIDDKERQKTDEVNWLGLTIAKIHEHLKRVKGNYPRMEIGVPQAYKVICALFPDFHPCKQTFWNYFSIDRCKKTYGKFARPLPCIRKGGWKPRISMDLQVLVGIISAIHTHRLEYMNQYQNSGSDTVSINKKEWEEIKEKAGKYDELIKVFESMKTMGK